MRIPSNPLWKVERHGNNNIFLFYKNHVSLGPRPRNLQKMLRKWLNIEEIQGLEPVTAPHFDKMSSCH